ncbi:hypothetical protein GYH30_033674 [Glycine max]|nr:hypothetical protein GYH30_033674 [Glycine max]
MSGTSKVLPALHSIKSLPPKFKIITGNPTSDLMENHGDAKLRSSDVIGSGSPENDVLIAEVAEEAWDRAGDMGVYDEDSVYNKKCVSLEDRPSIADEDLESIPLPSHQFQSPLGNTGGVIRHLMLRRRYFWLRISI